jgi:hypothetical protein
MPVNVRLVPRKSINVTTNFTQLGVVAPPTKLADLQDFDPSDLKDKYVIMYDSVTERYITVNPDKVLKAATTEPEQPGLPGVFLDELDVELDNRINLDGGTF